MSTILVLGTVGREKIHSCGLTSPIVFGGTAFYGTEALLCAGASEPVLVCSLGNDITPQELSRQFSKPIKIEELHSTKDLPSFFWEALYDHGSEESQTIRIENRLLQEFDPDWMRLRAQSPYIRFCYLAGFDPGKQLTCARHFSDCFILSETLEYWIERERQEVLELTKQSNGFVVTEREFTALFEARSATEIMKWSGLAFLIVTFGRGGSLVFDAQGSFFMPALRCKTIDPTGAGNAFSGGLLAHLSQCNKIDRQHLVDAVALGTVLASLQVRDFSNQALRGASSAEISVLWQEVKSTVEWIDFRA